VIELLTNMRAEVEQETLVEGAKQAAALEDTCIEDQAKFESDVKYQSEKADELKAHSENESAKSAAYSAEADQLVPEIAKLQNEQKTAKTQRKEEEKVFRVEEGELVEANTVLMQAYRVLKRTLAGEAKDESLIQLINNNSGNREKKESILDETQKLVSALSVVVDSAWIDLEPRKKIKAFLESAPGLDNLLSLSMSQPQATTSSYETRSGGILQTIADLQEKTAAGLSKLRESDLKKSMLLNYWFRIWWPKWSLKRRR